MHPLPAETRAAHGGLFTRGQFLQAGGTPADLQRGLRRREIVRIHRGVFLGHTGTPDRTERAWAGVLVHRPAALGGWDALEAAMGPRWRPPVVPESRGALDVVVPAGRHPRPVPGVRARQVTAYAVEVLANLAPPRQRVEYAVLDVLPGLERARGEWAGFALIAEVCGAGRSTPARVRRALADRARMPGRRRLEAVLRDLEEGSCSVLEREYRLRVERAHGLPTPQRQVREGEERAVVRDVAYPRWSVLIELDGRAFHDAPIDRERDLARDPDAAAAGMRTLRVGWSQAVRDPCRTASQVARILAASGWAGTPRPCGPACGIASTSVHQVRRGGSVPSPGAVSAIIWP